MAEVRGYGVLSLHRMNGGDDAGFAAIAVLCLSAAAPLRQALGTSNLGSLG